MPIITNEFNENNILGEPEDEVIRMRDEWSNGRVRHVVFGQYNGNLHRWVEFGSINVPIADGEGDTP
jgi:hypothetical protein